MCVCVCVCVALLNKRASYYTSAPSQQFFPVFCLCFPSTAAHSQLFPRFPIRFCDMQTGRRAPKGMLCKCKCKSSYSLSLSLSLARSLPCPLSLSLSLSSLDTCKAAHNTHTHTHVPYFLAVKLYCFHSTHVFRSLLFGGKSRICLAEFE